MPSTGKDGPKGCRQLVVVGCVCERRVEIWSATAASIVRFRQEEGATGGEWNTCQNLHVKNCCLIKASRCSHARELYCIESENERFEILHMNRRYAADASR